MFMRLLKENGATRAGAYRAKFTRQDKFEDHLRLVQAGIFAVSR